MNSMQGPGAGVHHISNVSSSSPLLGPNRGSGEWMESVAGTVVSIGAAIAFAGCVMLAFSAARVAHVPKGANISNVLGELLAGCGVMAAGGAMIAWGCCKKTENHVWVHPGHLQVLPPAGSTGYTPERADRIRALRAHGGAV